MMIKDLDNVNTLAHGHDSSPSTFKIIYDG